MEKQMEGVDVRELTLWECFDQIFLKHIGRLIGTPHGIEGLPLNLVNSACLILLTEQITEEIENFSTPAERYTRPTLFDELSDMGLTSEEDTETIFDDLIGKGYVEEDSKGGLSAKKPAISMAQLLDRVFPRMPGMNLIASLAQTIDETLSGRRDLEDATQRFDQMLRMQGVSILPENTPSEPGESQAPRSAVIRTHEVSSVTPSSMPSTPTQRRKLSDIYVFQPGTQPKPETSPPETVAPHGVEPSPETEAPGTSIDGAGSLEKTAPVAPQQQETQETEEIQGQPPLIEAEEGRMETREVSPTESVALEGDTRSEPLSREATMDESTSSLESDPSLFSSSEAPVDEDTGFSGVPEETLPPEPPALSEEEDIESRIAQFEGALALQCPLCKTGVISEEATTTGRVFYKCTAPDCQFISWGKPFHIVCPQCENPFLVEVIGRDGKYLLKCPRATCTHWQAHPSEPGDSPEKTAPAGSKKKVLVRTGGSGRSKKRVVKRRVVRRKR